MKLGARLIYSDPLYASSQAWDVQYQPIATILPLTSAIDLTNLTQTIRPAGGGATLDLLFSAAIGFARALSEIQLDSRWFVITLKEVSSRVSFLGYLKF